MGARTVRPSMALSISNLYILKYGGSPADGRHPGGRRTGGHPGGRRTGGHPGGRRTGGRYTTDGHTCLRYGGREDAEGAPTWRQGRRINTLAFTNGHGRYISGVDPFSTPQLFYTYFYNHAHRLRLEKLLYIELSRSPNGFFKPLLDPGGGFTS
jgi:hypothetical protein